MALEDEAEACLWDRDGSVEDLLSKMEKESSKILKSVSTIHSFVTVASDTDSFFSINGDGGVDAAESVAGGGSSGKCTNCNGVRDKLEEMKKLHEDSKKQIAEVQQKLKVLLVCC